jgi:hypothetical protein
MATHKNSKKLKAVQYNLSEMKKSMKTPTKFELNADKGFFISA